MLIPLGKSRDISVRSLDADTIGGIAIFFRGVCDYFMGGDRRGLGLMDDWD